MTDPSMPKWCFRRVGKAVVIEIPERFEITGHDLDGMRLDIEALLQEGQRFFVFDCTRTKNINSSAYGAILLAYKSMTASEAKSKLVPSQDVKRGWSSLLGWTPEWLPPICDELRTAIDSFEGE
jgi:anti-anti-sigma regulatory factor